MIVLLLYLIYKVLASFRTPPEIKDSRVINITSIDQYMQSLKSNKLVLVDFYAEWCPPCRAASPEFAKLSTQFTNTSFLKVNVDHVADVAKKENIQSMPTFKLFVNGDMNANFTGFDKTKIVNKLTELGEVPSTKKAE